MTALLVSLLVAVTFLGTWLSAVHMALWQASRSRVERLVAARKRTGKVELGWLFDRQESIDGCLSILVVGSRVGVFVLLLMLFDGQPLELLAASLVAVGVIWVFTVALAGAIARHLGESVLVVVLGPLRAAGTIMRPVGAVNQVIDEVIRRLSGANLREEEAEEELLRSVEDTQREGGLDPVAAEMIENVVEFSSTDVGTVMTPRTDIEGIELTDDLSSIRTFIAEVGHSRIPVYGENLDDIHGILYVKDLVPYLGTEGEGFSLKSVLRRPIRIPETKPVGDLLRDFQQSEVHMAIVIDEYGGTAGLVTIEDVLEEIVGEIQDEHDPEDEEPHTLDKVVDGRWEVDGRYHIDDLNEELELDLPEDEDYDTVAGFMLARLGRVPEIGDSFTIQGHRFHVLAAAPTHIERVGIERIAEDAEAES
ncbi:MAG: hemolysin family protein [Phycisphaerales bacterium]|nr:hemolysin family protein [Phycisphaerales bacterium]